MKYKAGDRVKVKNEFDIYEEYQGKQFVIEECDSSDDTYLCHPTTGGYRIWFSEERLEPVDSKTLRMADGTIIGEFNTGGVLPTSEWSKLTFKNDSSIEALPQKDDTVRGENHFRTGFEAPYLDLSVFSNDGISAKNGGKNSMKFTFYVTEGYRIDKSNNTKIPTMTTEVLVNGKDYQYGGSATCDKADYEEREGVLNAIANAVCGGNFDKEFNKVMKNKAFANKKSRTCTYCGRVFDTIEELKEHEAWHIERKKARRERYLLRKRAKEIAFEEQAQKLAKEMIAENKKEAK